ncbi:amino acid ABC transporter permease [Castellaniella sp.]|uniref:amino acid ABC transporter permease n=1 Tax=Castellaniella sp. TaxID=1955812 RepID=UPI00355FC6E7
MAFDLQFAPILAHTPALLDAFWLTLKLSFGAVFLGCALGLLASTARIMLPRYSRWLVDLYVETIRNTPLLVQLYIIFFALPVVGIRLSAVYAGLLALTINLGAYSTEIFRAGIESIHRSQIEAGMSLSLTRWQVFMHIMLKPAVARIWPSLVSQIILTMLGSSICSFISVQEISGEAYTIQSLTYRSFEIYIVASLMYLALSLLLKGMLTVLGHYLFTPRRQRRTWWPAGTAQKRISS